MYIIYIDNRADLLVRPVVFIKIRNTRKSVKKLEKNLNKSVDNEEIIW